MLVKCLCCVEDGFNIGPTVGLKFVRTDSLRGIGNKRLNDWKCSNGINGFRYVSCLFSCLAVFSCFLFLNVGVMLTDESLNQLKFASAPFQQAFNIFNTFDLSTLDDSFKSSRQLVQQNVERVFTAL